MGVTNWDIGLRTILEAQGISETEWTYYLNDWLALEPVSEVVGEVFYPLIELTTDQQQTIIHRVAMDFVGFTMLEPDPSDPSMAYADPDTILASSNLLTRKLPDINDIRGQTLNMSLQPISVSFLNTYGLKEIDADDFDISINIEI